MIFIKNFWQKAFELLKLENIDTFSLMYEYYLGWTRILQDMKLLRNNLTTAILEFFVRVFFFFDSVRIFFMWVT